MRALISTQLNTRGAPSPDLQNSLCVQLFHFWNSVFSTLAAWCPETPSSQLLNLGNLLGFPTSVSCNESLTINHRTHYIYFSSLRDHCPSLLSSVLKIIVSYEFKPFFICFTWEGKSLLCYSTLNRSRRQLPSLLMMNMSFQKSIREPLISCSKENKFSHLFRTATSCKVFLFSFLIK